MKNLLALAAFLVLLFVAVGYFRGWYQIQSSPTQGGGNRVTIDFNSTKIHQDLNKGKEKLKSFLNTDENKKVANEQDADTIQQTNHTVVNEPQSQQPGQTLPLQQTKDGTFVLPGQTPTANQKQQIPHDSWIFPQPQSTPPQQTQPQPWIFPPSTPQTQSNSSPNSGIWFVPRK